MTDTLTPESDHKISWKKYLLYFLLVFIAICVGMRWAGQKLAANYANPQDMAGAQARLIGTWTYTAALPTSGGSTYPSDWVKWQIGEDETMLIWHAHPTDHDWGNPTKYTYAIITGTSPEGQSWYGIQDPSTPDGIGVIEGGHLILRLKNSSSGVPMVHHDASPFTK